MHIRKEAADAEYGPCRVWPLQSMAGKLKMRAVRESNIFNSPTQRQCFMVATLEAEQS